MRGGASDVTLFIASAALSFRDDAIRQPSPRTITGQTPPALLHNDEAEKLAC